MEESPVEEREVTATLLAYLEFIDQQMLLHPEMVQPVDAHLLARMDALVAGMDIDLTEELGEDAQLP